MIPQHQRLIEGLVGKRLKDMKKLNLGCGADYRVGWVNADFSDSPEVRTDRKWDFTKLPLKIKDEEFDYIFSSHTLEHLSGTLTPLLIELWRGLTPGGVLEIRVPHFSHYSALTGFEHRNAFSINGFSLFADTSFFKHIPGLPDFKKPLFKVVSSKLNHQRTDDGNRFLIPKNQRGLYYSLAKLISFLANLNTNFCEKIWCYWVGGFQEMQVILRKIPQDIILEKNYFKKLMLPK